ncbi:MAG: sulfotransferase family protein [Pusillimonas sp.]|uniref:tetratricopeptide repeat-containing sulfotransferase family protein n=2 Tax=Rhodanobacter sp. FW021-MT20 TaxID=1162282 RepID=UPI0012056C88|nr:MAG: sulfotransferase family protein [Pusillimonas sp.]
MTNSEQTDVQAIAAFNRRDWRTALTLAEARLTRAPRDAGMRYVAGVACLELQRLPHALLHLRQAVALDMKRAEFAVPFAKALSIARLQGEALMVANHAMALAPGDPASMDTLGVVFTQCNAHRKAVTAFRQASSMQPAQAHHRFNLATALIATGELEEAKTQLDACIKLNPALWKAYLTRAQLHRCTTESHHLDDLTALLPSLQDDTSRMYVHLALAKEYEDLGHYANSFAHLVKGKAAAGAGRDYDIGRDAALVDALEEAFKTAASGPPGNPSPEPIFVIGMPRSGTTLVERIVSSHPDVYSAGELQNFGTVLKRMSGSTTAPILDADTITKSMHLDWAELGRHYVASTRPATGHTPRFLDKLPHNFLYAGFIARALPNAKIICLRRDPMDTCLSNFRQLFAQSSPYYNYSFDLLDTGRYYVLFDHLMATWRHLFPNRILEIGYEELVTSPESGARQIVDFCGLGWHDNCVQTEHNPQPVATASSVQVRAPIHRGFVQRWKHYENELRPLQDLLREAGIDPPNPG